MDAGGGGCIRSVVVVVGRRCDGCEVRQDSVIGGRAPPHARRWCAGRCGSLPPLDLQGGGSAAVATSRAPLSDDLCLSASQQQHYSQQLLMSAHAVTAAQRTRTRSVTQTPPYRPCSPSGCSAT